MRFGFTSGFEDELGRGIFGIERDRDAVGDGGGLML